MIDFSKLKSDKVKEEIITRGKETYKSKSEYIRSTGLHPDDEYTQDHLREIGKKYANDPDFRKRYDQHARRTSEETDRKKKEEMEAKLIYYFSREDSSRISSDLIGRLVDNQVYPAHMVMDYASSVMSYMSEGDLTFEEMLDILRDDEIDSIFDKIPSTQLASDREKTRIQSRRDNKKRGRDGTIAADVNANVRWDTGVYKEWDFRVLSPKAIYNRGGSNPHEVSYDRSGSIYTNSRQVGEDRRIRSIEKNWGGDPKLETDREQLLTLAIKRLVEDPKYNSERIAEYPYLKVLIMYIHWNKLELFSFLDPRSKGEKWYKLAKKYWDKWDAEMGEDSDYSRGKPNLYADILGVNGRKVEKHYLEGLKELFIDLFGARDGKEVFEILSSSKLPDRIPSQREKTPVHKIEKRWDDDEGDYEGVGDNSLWKGPALRGNPNTSFKLKGLPSRNEGLLMKDGKFTNLGKLVKSLYKTYRKAVIKSDTKGTGNIKMSPFNMSILLFIALVNIKKREKSSYISIQKSFKTKNLGSLVLKIMRESKTKKLDFFLNKILVQGLSK